MCCMLVVRWPQQTGTKPSFQFEGSPLGFRGNASANKPQGQQSRSQYDSRGDDVDEERKDTKSNFKIISRLSESDSLELHLKVQIGGAGLPALALRSFCCSPCSGFLDGGLHPRCHLLPPIFDTTSNWKLLPCLSARVVVAPLPQEGR